MADVIEIRLVQGADVDGLGGTEIASPKVLMADGDLAEILQAFAIRKGLTRILPDGTEETLTPEQNFTFRLREYTEQILEEADFHYRREAAIAQSKAAVEAKKANVSIVEGKRIHR